MKLKNYMYIINNYDILIILIIFIKKLKFWK
jgi:hypothetical protein